MGSVRKFRQPSWRRKNGNGNGNGNGRNGNGGNGNGKKPSAYHKAIFEPLEPRILLSSDLAYAGAAAFDLTLRLDDDGVNPATLRLIDNTTTTAVAEQALSETNSVIVSGSTGADRLVVDLGTPFDLLGGVSFTDTSGMDGDLLEVIGKPNTWIVDSSDAGSVDNGGGIQFSGIEHISGGPDADVDAASGKQFFQGAALFRCFRMQWKCGPLDVQIECFANSFNTLLISSIKINSHSKRSDSDATNWLHRTGMDSI